jgi:gluconate 5-dehydrogenase
MTQEVVLVTGSTGAVGSVVARSLYASGYVVALSGRRLDELTKLQASLGENSFAVGGSLDAEGDAERTLRTIAEKKGRLDALVSTIGGIDPTWPSLHEASEAAILNLLQLNLMAPLRIAKAAAAHMKPGGRMVFISSRGGLLPQRGPYDLSKAALQGMLTILAAELKPKGIRVNAIAPGIILTNANQQAMPGVDTSGWVKPEEIAETARFLLSPAANNITGSTLPMFGA